MIHDEDNRLDVLFRNGLEQFSPEPAPGLWERIQSGLEQEQYSRRISLYRWAAVAAVLLLAFTTGVWLTGNLRVRQPSEVATAGAEGSSAAGTRQTTPGNPSPSDLPGTQGIPSSGSRSGSPGKQTASGSSVIIAELSAGESPVLAGKSQTAGQPVPFPDTHPSDVNHREQTATTRQADMAEQPGTSALPSEPSAPLVRHLISLATMKIIVAFVTYPSYHKELMATGKTVIFPAKELVLQDNMVASAALTAKETRGNHAGNWKIGIHMDPAYSSYSSGYSQEYASRMNPVDVQAETALGGGMSVQYIAAGRLRFESGIRYSRSSDRQGNAPVFSSHAYFDLFPGEGSKYYSASVAPDNGELAVNSTAGVINFDKNPLNAALVTIPESAIGLNTALITSGDLSQVFDFVEIPLTIRYALLDARIGIDLFSGISTNLLVGNNVYLENQSGRQQVGTTRDISTVNFSGLAGFGISYPLGKHFSVSVEPRASYFLNSLNNSGNVDFKPWKVGLYTGLNYEF